MKKVSLKEFYDRWFDSNICELCEKCCEYHCDMESSSCHGRYYGDGFWEPREWSCDNEDCCPYLDEYAEGEFKDKYEDGYFDSDLAEDEEFEDDWNQ